MKLEKLVGERFKERPADCQIDSHALMLKGGYMKQLANGIYSLLYLLHLTYLSLFGKSHQKSVQISYKH